MPPCVKDVLRKATEGQVLCSISVYAEGSGVSLQKQLGSKGKEIWLI